MTWISDYQVRLGETPSWVVEELDLPKFTGGLVGYFSYDTIQYVEPRVAKTLPDNDPIGSPDIILMRSDDVVVFDNLSGMLTLITHANPQEADAYETAHERLDDILDDLASAMDPSAFIPLNTNQLLKLIISTA